MLPGLEDRHVIYIYPPLIFCLMLVLMAIVGKKGVIICSLILLFLSARVFIANFPSIKQGDSARVASYLMDSEKPNQPILVYRSGLALPLAVHYSGINEIVPIPRKMSLERYDLYDWVIKNETELSQVFLSVLNDCQHFWLVTDTILKYRGIKFSHELLEDFISKEYTTVTTKSFVGSKVRFMCKKKPCSSIEKRILRNRFGNGLHNEIKNISHLIKINTIDTIAIKFFNKEPFKEPFNE